MLTSNVFLQTILDEPEDTTHRLVFADWLDEHGDSDRAEFIRVQCQVALLSQDDPGRPALEARQDELLRTHGPKWLAEAPAVPGVTWIGFECGFLTRAAVELSRWDSITDGAAKMFALPTLREVRFHDVTPDTLPLLLRLPHLARLSGLSLSGQPVGDEGVRSLAATPSLAGLKSLDLSCNGVGPRGAEALASSPHLSRLTVLRLYDNQVGTAGLWALTSSPRLGRLETLFLKRNQIGREGAHALALAPALTRLHTLNLSHNNLGEAGTRALASRPLPGLRVLCLDNNQIGDRGARALGAARFLASVNRLDVSFNHIGLAGGRALAEALNLDSLTELVLRGNVLPTHWVEEMKRRLGQRFLV
jgi:uncharacterized protein (TIGR02996 family)